MAGPIADNAIEKKTYTYVPPTPPTELIDSTSYTLNFVSRKFINIGNDPTANFDVAINLITSSRHVQLTPAFLKRIFSLMGNVLSFILYIPQSYKRTIFLETDFYKLSSMVYGGINVLVIESKTEDGCRILLNRADLLQLQRLERSIYASIKEKVVFIKAKIIKEMNQYCDYLVKKCLQEDAPKPKNVHEMRIFINNVEEFSSGQFSQNQYLSQIMMYASTQLAELCMTQLNTQNSQVPYDMNFRRCSSLSPSFSPVNVTTLNLYDDSSARDGFDHSGDVTLAKAFDQIDGPDEIPQSVDVNDGPDYFNRFYSQPPTYTENPVPSPTYNEHPVPTQKRSHSTFAEHPTPVRKVKRRLF